MTGNRRRNRGPGQLEFPSAACL